VLWAWDFSGTGSGPFNVTGVNQNNVVITAPSGATFPYSFPVRLQVTDNSTPVPLTAITTATITITNPPFPPTASAGGPYNICPQAGYLPFYLNGTGSKFAPGHLANSSDPDNFITSYAWDVQGNGTYLPSVTGAQPRVDNVYQTLGLLGSGSTLLVGLTVTDNSAASFGAPSNLTGVGTAQVVLRAATDTLCSKCVATAQAVGHAAVPGTPAYISLVWSETGADHYNIYRGTANGGPYTKVGTVANTIVGTGKNMAYQDTAVSVGTTYFYRIAPATLADVETCQSNQANASGSIPATRR
jgi:hypothetical protein